MLTSLRRGFNLFAKRSKLETGHGVGVYVLASPEGEAVVCALYLEPELLIEGDTMSFQMTKRFGVRFHALIDEVGCEQLEVAEA